VVYRIDGKQATFSYRFVYDLMKGETSEGHTNGCLHLLISTHAYLSYSKHCKYKISSPDRIPRDLSVGLIRKYNIGDSVYDGMSRIS